jgi:hypothetical protein
MKDINENDFINAAIKSGLIDMSLGLSEKEQCKRMSKTNYKE